MGSHERLVDEMERSVLREEWCERMKMSNKRQKKKQKKKKKRYGVS